MAVLLSRFLDITRILTLMAEDMLSLDEAIDCNGDFFLVPDDRIIEDIFELEAKDCNYFFFADGKNIVKDIL